MSGTCAWTRCFHQLVNHLFIYVINLYIDAFYSFLIFECVIILVLTFLEVSLKIFIVVNNRIFIVEEGHLFKI